MIKYYFTTFGDVYAGFDFSEMNFPDLKIIVQADKLHEYQELRHEDKSLEKIKEYAYVFPLSAFVGEVDSEDIPNTQRPHIENRWSLEYDRKILFVFGAGASAHCVGGSRKTEFEKDELRPPLGNELFASKLCKVYGKYEGVNLSLNGLQHDKVNVEEYLEEEWKEVQEHGNQAVMSRHINIQFYLQELLMEVSMHVCNEYDDDNLYAKLTDKLQKINARDSKRHFSFVSFNQDTILEYFLSKYFRQTLTNIDAYIDVNESPFCVFKPHGSWNWGWKFPDRIANRQKYLFDKNVNFFKLYFETLGNHIDMVDWNGWGIEKMLNVYHKGKLNIDKSKLALFDENCIGDYYLAILLPYRDKDEFTMPLKHFKNMQRYFSTVETLIIIGWKGNEDAFNRLLLKHAQRIRKVVIADPNPKIVENNVKELLLKPNIKKVVYENFKDFVENGLDKEIS